MKMKRFAAVILLLAVILTALPITGSAAEEDFKTYSFPNRMSRKQGDAGYSFLYGPSMTELKECELAPIDTNDLSLISYIALDDNMLKITNAGYICPGSENLAVIAWTAPEDGIVFVDSYYLKAWRTNPTASSDGNILRIHYEEELLYEKSFENWDNAAQSEFIPRIKLEIKKGERLFFSVDSKCLMESESNFFDDGYWNIQIKHGNTESAPDIVDDFTAEIKGAFNWPQVWNDQFNENNENTHFEQGREGFSALMGPTLSSLQGCTMTVFSPDKNWEPFIGTENNQPRYYTIQRDGYFCPGPIDMNVIRWVAPYDCDILVDWGVIKYAAYNEDAVQKDGVTLSVVHDNLTESEVVFEKSLMNPSTISYYQYKVPVQVKEGDKLYFTVSSNVDNYSDNGRLSINIATYEPGTLPETFFAAEEVPEETQPVTEPTTPPTEPVENEQVSQFEFGKQELFATILAGASVLMLVVSAVILRGYLFGRRKRK